MVRVMKSDTYGEGLADAYFLVHNHYRFRYRYSLNILEIFLLSMMFCKSSDDVLPSNG